MPIKITGIKKRNELLFVRKIGLRYHSDIFSCHFICLNKNYTFNKTIIEKINIPKFLVTVSMNKKIGKAVLRNKIRRRFKNALYFLLKNTHLSTIIFIQVKLNQDYSYKNIYENLEKFIKEKIKSQIIN